MMMGRAAGRDEPVQLRARSVGIPVALQVAVWLARRLVRLIAFVVSTPLVLAAVVYSAALVMLGTMADPTVMVVAAVGSWLVAGGALVVWAKRWPDGFSRHVANRFRAAWRKMITYRRAWQPAVQAAGLTYTQRDHEHIPSLRRVCSTRFVDAVRVRMLPGQTVSGWAKRADELAQSFGRTECRVVAVPDKPRLVELRLRVKDPLADPVPPVAPGDKADLEGLPVGRTEDGQPYLLRVVQRHVLLVGATGAGKSGVIWSIIAQLVPAVLDRTAELWVLDPKGGMELGPGRALYARFCRAEGDDWAGEFAALLAEAVQVMRQRQNHLYAAHERCFTPGPSTPLIVIVIDEIAALTAWINDRNLQREISGHLGLLLSQGRSAGVCVIAATQDPRKETLSIVRDLTPTRILLRLAEANHVDLSLGPGARERGAYADKISESMPGTAYVLVEGAAEPLRIRFARTTDYDITELTARIKSGRTVPVGDGQVFPIGDPA